MYQYESKVRFSETDAKRKLTLEAIVDYFQDCSTFQTEELGVGFSYLLPKNLTWILLYWQIVVDEYPSLGEKITISTIPYEFKGFMGKRNFFMENEEGKVIVKADSLWSLLDMQKMVPVKVPEEAVSRYPQEDKIEMEYLPRKITINGTELTNYLPTALDVSANMISPEFMFASSYGACPSQMSKENAERRCATYQEDGYPAGRWRLPTEAEVKYAIQLKGWNVIPELFSSSMNYWSAHGKITGSAVNNGNTNTAVVRCVYDTWYWGTEHTAGSTTYVYDDTRD